MAASAAAPTSRRRSRLGAKCVLIGRPTLYGTAVAGETRRDARTQRAAGSELLYTLATLGVPKIVGAVARHHPRAASGGARIA